MREKIIEAYKTICNKGLVIFSWGNISIKQENNILITPSGIPVDLLSPNKIVEVNYNKEYKGDFKPSVDTGIHLELYKSFDNINSIIHTHSPYVTSFAQARKSIPCLGTTHADYFYQDIPIARDLNKDEIFRDFEKYTGKSVVDTFKNLNINSNNMKACLLPNHGSLVWGESLEKCLENALVLEEIAKLAYRTLTLISPNTKPFMDINIINKHFNRKNGKNKYYGQ
jgi:L-ribulose-5-phosphate 4-epimerase